VQKRLKHASSQTRPRVLALTILLAPAMVYAQAVPQAGQILEANKPPALIAPPAATKKVLPDAKSPSQASESGKERVMIKRFVLEGASAFPEATLQGVLAPYTNRELTFAEVNEAAAALTKFYRAHGYFLASAFLPEQDMTQGTVRVIMLEGRVSEIRLIPDATVRLKPALARRYLDALVKPGAPLHEDTLERGLLLTQDLPGMSVRAELSPGAQVGETSVDVAMSEGPLFSGNVGLDNSSNRYTGRTRATAGFNLNDLGGMGGQLSTQLSTTGSDFNYGRLGYVAPVGSHGTRLGAAYSRMRYHLGGQFEAANASGTAEIAQLLAVHPLIRSRYLSVQLRGGYEDKRFYNVKSGVAEDKNIAMFLLGVSGSMQDELLGGGLSTASIELNGGDVDVPGNTDALTPKGAFVKTNYQLGRYQRLGANTALVLNVSGQMATKNLDSGEKMSLGGVGRVRAYPAGEASGDEGHVLTLEMRFNLPSLKSEFSTFYDYGHIRLDKKPVSVPATGPGNSYDLQGIGAGIQWNAAKNIALQVQVATKIGKNPAPNFGGTDVDGSDSRTRAWFQASVSF
jgi:hemolysin activation/secretion protein